jgi:hypothetical protein
MRADRGMRSTPKAAAEQAYAGAYACDEDEHSDVDGRVAHAWAAYIRAPSALLLALASQREAAAAVRWGSGLCGGWGRREECCGGVRGQVIPCKKINVAFGQRVFPAFACRLCWRASRACFGGVRDVCLSALSGGCWERRSALEEVG